MRLTPKERASRKAAFREMSLAGKAGYLYEYFKLPILLGVIALALFCSFVYRQLTKKEVVLYSAHVNASAGDELTSRLTEGYISASGADLRRTELYLYSGLYLSEDPSPENHEYQYASRLKILASIESKQLDIVLMNKEAYDIFSQNGYLLDLQALLAQQDSLCQLLEPCLTENTVIIEDNAIEYALHEASRYQAITEEAVNGLEVSSLPLFQEAGFSDPVYLGVVANSPRLPAVMQYIEYLAGALNAEGPPAD